MAATGEVWLAGRGGAAAIAMRQRDRLRQMVAWAQTHSPYYRRLYAGVDLTPLDIRALPPVDKHDLMAHFDEWVTDTAVTRLSVGKFIGNLSYIGQPFLGRYAAWTSSGTTGQPGIFLHDAEALAVYDALQAVRFGAAALTPNFLLSSLASGGRFAMVAATGGHFAGVVSIERLRRLNPFMAANARTFSILQPLKSLVEELNAFQPSFLATYPTAATVLGTEQAAGRLSIRPSAVWTGGEWLSPGARRWLERVFGCQVLDDYGSSEFMCIAHDCGHGWLHVNEDWVILEPVDERGQPVEPGTPSHTVLMTNLANKVQPFIRYDLGDSVTFKPHPCACGNPLAALRVEGRRDDILVFGSAHDQVVRLLPLALSTVVEEAAQVFDFQLVQTGDRTLRVRLEHRNESHWAKVLPALKRYLHAQGLDGVEVGRDDTAPVRSAISGKVRRVICEAGS
jgi:phenylacetate-coenzyme A ligase PaaK-like adenylate-forming protein